MTEAQGDRIIQGMIRIHDVIVMIFEQLSMLNWGVAFGFGLVAGLLTVIAWKGVFQ
jgi:hypothetical protein